MKLNPQISIIFLATSLSLGFSLGLTACSTNKVSEGASSGNSSDHLTSNPNSGQQDSGTNTASGTNTGTETGAGNNSQASESKGGAEGFFSSALDDIPQLKPLQKVNIAKLPPSTVLCTVSGIPITVSAFKREFSSAVGTLQQLLSAQPDKVAELCSQAPAMQISLTEDEKKRILATAHSPKALEGKSFDDFLKARKMTAKDFESQVINLGLAFKVGAKIIESKLLSEMINRDLILAEAAKQGYHQKALNSWVKAKSTPEYKQLLATSPASPAEIKDEIIEAEEMKMVLQRIIKNVNVSDDQLKQAYETHKSRFTHGELLRLSHIVVAMPEVDYGPLESVRTQLKKQFPNASDAELKTEEQNFRDGQLKKAQDLLNKAKNGDDFKTLADHYTDDIPARDAKNGGDLGFIDTAANIGPDQLKILSAAKDLKVGEVAPQLVQTNFGYHIVKLTNKQAPGPRSFDEVREPLKQYLTDIEMTKARDKWISQMRRSAQIVLSPECQKEIAKEASSNTTAQHTEPTAGKNGTTANSSTETGRPNN